MIVALAPRSGGGYGHWCQIDTMLYILTSLIFSRLGGKMFLGSVIKDFNTRHFNLAILLMSTYTSLMLTLLSKAVLDMKVNTFTILDS